MILMGDVVIQKAGADFEEKISSVLETGRICKGICLEHKRNISAMQIWGSSVGSWGHRSEFNDPVILCGEKRVHTNMYSVSTESRRQDSWDTILVVKTRRNNTESSRDHAK